MFTGALLHLAESNFNIYVEIIWNIIEINAKEYILPYDCGELHKEFELECAIEIKTVDGSAFPATLLRDYPMHFESE